MYSRIFFNGIGLIALFFMPWWVMLIWGFLGVVLFSWYLEIIFFGLYFDVMFGYAGLPLGMRVIHTGIFLLPLVVGEFIKRGIRL